MRAATAIVLATATLTGGAAAPTTARTTLDAPLQRHAPIYSLDRDERSPPTSVREAAEIAPDLVTLVAHEPPGPHVYARATGAIRGRAYLQYWTFHRDNPQDRGIVRTGRHAGDWELVQVRLQDGRPASATYLQHSWAERCPWGRTERAGPKPVVHVANGSHAAYFSRGTHGRPWPDPDDEARDGGRTLRPPVIPVTATEPPWMAYSGRWGASRAGAVPGEHSSPHGPAFQPERWDDPARLERTARPCGAGAPERPWQLAVEAIAALAALIALVVCLRRRR
jgi:hypothetical protein